LPPDIDPRYAAVFRAQARVWKNLADGMRKPWMTVSILVVICLAHLLVGVIGFSQGQITLPGIIVGSRPTGNLIFMGAMYGPWVDQGEVWRLVSCLFLHGDGTHILLNGIALYGLGRLSESVYGPVRFLWLFLFAGVCGSTLSYLGGNTASVGASGSIFGLMGACIVFGFRYRLVLPPHIGELFRRKLLPWVGINLMIGLIIPFIDNLGHFGGLVGGAVFATFASNRIVPSEKNALTNRILMGSISGITLVVTLGALLLSWVMAVDSVR
jgi:membrane associated rhomboid family serine protease